MRLLRCMDCRTIEELPDPPRGVNPANIHPGEDPLFDELLKRHRFPNGEPHRGDLHTLTAEDWANEEARTLILEQLGHTKTGLPDENYAQKATFTEDAGICFNDHGRPERCIDWMSDKKILGRPTEEGRRWQRENFKAPTVHLCHFCPVATSVMVRQRAERGDYG